MIEIRVLGGLQLMASDGRDVGALVHHAKRAALLAYIAAARPRGPHRRDKLLALFWPEFDGPRARAALSQAVYFLRATLGDDAITRDGDGVVGIADVAWCDATAFEAALDAGKPAEALALYRGDLLDGFFIPGAPEFERWIESERERLRARASAGAWALAEAKTAEGDVFEAVRWARWAAERAPADETAIRRLMTFLCKLGDRSAAIRAYEAFIARLGEEYELEPSAETRALAASIREEEPPVPATLSGEVRAPARSGVRLGARRRHFVGRVTAVAAVTAVAVGAWIGLRAPARHPPVVRFPLTFPADHEIAVATSGSSIALSPDGSQLVYLARAPSGTELFLRRMDRVEAVPIPETRGAVQPFFSPDGEWLGFVAEERIRKVRLDGGPAISVTTVETPVQGASWGPNDVIVFATPAGLWRVPAGGGEARLVAAVDTTRGERYRWPVVLPSGRGAVFTMVDEAGFQLAAVSLETGALQRLGLGGTNPLFLVPGYLLFARADGTLMATPFDPGAQRITGPGLPVTGGVQVGVAGAAKVAVSHSGVLAYVTAPSSERALATVDRAGVAEDLPFTPRGLNAARASPDGRWIAMVVGSEPDIWVLDRDAGTFRRLTFDGASMTPVWSPDGKRIAFQTGRPSGQPGWAVRWTPRDRTDSAATLRLFESMPAALAFMPDARALLLQTKVESRHDIWVLPLDGEGRLQAFLSGPSDEHSPAVSPDGRWLAYVSNETGREEVYVRPFPGPGSPVRVSSRGGHEPQWASSGRELFYRSNEGMVAVAVGASPGFTVGRHTVLFDDKPYLSHQYGRAYDVQPDGRFLMIRRGSEKPEVMVLLNWLHQIR